MRKSAVVKLTLVPLLAASALAYAQAPGASDSSGPGMSPPAVQAPGMIDPALSPPGMTPSIDELPCDDDPNWELRNDCSEATIDGEDVVIETDVVRGGYGHYFWTGGG